MVAGAFPLVKLGYLAVKQVSKPLANLIKRNARASPFFSKYVCMPPAQIYHWLEVNFRLRLMNMGKAKKIERLTDEMALELGSEMLGEFIIFGVAAGILLLEYNRSATKEALKEEQEKQERLRFRQKIRDIEEWTRVQEAQIKDLQRSVDFLESKNKK